MDVLQGIHELGHTADFRNAALQRKAFVTVHPETVNFIKDYLHDNKLHEQHALAQNVVDSSPQPDPFTCPLEQS